MRRVLVLAYHFPPIGGAGTQRSTKLVRYLSELGFSPVVLTGAGDAAGRWTPRDPTLQGDIPPHVRVLRMGEGAAPESGAWRARAERWLGVERPWSRWWTRSVLREGSAAAAEADLIFAPLVPYEASTAAVQLSLAAGKPLVVDLLDPWALDEMMVYPTGAHRRQGLRAMRETLRAADAVVMNTAESQKRVLEAFPELQEKPVVAVPNGYDPADFAAPPPTRFDDAFRIVHTGYLHTELGREHRRTTSLHKVLGGSFDVDILTRSHVFLVEAVESLLQREHELGPIEIHLAGVLSGADRQVAAQSKHVHLHGYLPHQQAVELMRSADLLFLPMHELRSGGRVGIIPGKTFEYIAARRPILAAVPDGDARDLLLAAGNNHLCAPSDVGAVAAAIVDEIRRKRAGDPPRQPDEAVLAACEWRHRAEAIADLFDVVLRREERSDAFAAAQ